VSRCVPLASFLTSALDGVRGQLLILPALLPGKRAGTQFTGGWMGFGASQEGCEISCPHWGSNPEPCSPQRFTATKVKLWWSRRVAETIFNFGARWWWVARFTIQPLYLWEKKPWYPLNRCEVGWAPNLVWTFWRREDFLAPSWILYP
jgi:hypothetical protein